MITLSTSSKRSYHHGDLRAALVTAGLEILEEGTDPGMLSLREAARRAGVSAMAPYRHFADKETLLAAIATVGFEMLMDALNAASAATTPEAALESQGVAYVAFACEHPALFRLMFGRDGPRNAGALADAGRAAFQVLVEQVATLVPDAMVLDEALGHWAFVHGLAMLSIDGRLAVFDQKPVQLVERLASVAMDKMSAYLKRS